MKEPSMFHESFMIGTQHRAYRRLQSALSRRSLLSVVLASGLLYAAVGMVMAGDGPIPIVEVRLTEFTIQMPPTVPIGRVTFSVTNDGTMEHNFEIEGQGIEERFDTNLKPGELRSLQVDLAAGTYTVYCPVEDHKGRGMQLELKVAQQQSDMAPSSTGRRRK
jgi:hypothetical protein